MKTILEITFVFISTLLIYLKRSLPPKNIKLTDRCLTGNRILVSITILSYLKFKREIYHFHQVVMKYLKLKAEIIYYQMLAKL